MCFALAPGGRQPPFAALSDPSPPLHLPAAAASEPAPLFRREERPYYGGFFASAEQQAAEAEATAAAAASARAGARRRVDFDERQQQQQPEHAPRPRGTVPVPSSRAGSRAGSTRDSPIKSEVAPAVLSSPNRGLLEPAAGTGRPMQQRPSGLRCLRCGLNDESAPGYCAFHPFHLKGPSPFQVGTSRPAAGPLAWPPAGRGRMGRDDVSPKPQYGPEWHVCKSEGHSLDSRGCMVRREHYYATGPIAALLESIKI